MATKIRLARGGAKKRPFYRVVVADSRMPRDGRFIEKIGTYNPLLAKDDASRVQIQQDRLEYWIGQGAEMTDRIQRFVKALDVDVKAIRKAAANANGPKAVKAAPKPKTAKPAAKKAEPKKAEAKPAAEKKPATKKPAAKKPAAKKAAPKKAEKTEAKKDES